MIIFGVREMQSASFGSKATYHHQLTWTVAVPVAVIQNRAIDVLTHQRDFVVAVEENISSLSYRLSSLWLV